MSSAWRLRPPAEYGLFSGPCSWSLGSIFFPYAGYYGHGAKSTVHDFDKTFWFSATSRPSFATLTCDFWVPWLSDNGSASLCGFATFEVDGNGWSHWGLLQNPLVIMLGWDPGPQNGLWESPIQKIGYWPHIKTIKDSSTITCQLYPHMFSIYIYVCIYPHMSYTWNSPHGSYLLRKWDSSMIKGVKWISIFSDSLWIHRVWNVDNL